MQKWAPFLLHERWKSLVAWNIKKKTTKMSWQFYEKYLFFSYILSYTTKQHRFLVFWNIFHKKRYTNDFELKGQKKWDCLSGENCYIFFLISVLFMFMLENWTTKQYKINCDKNFIIKVRIKRCYSLPYKCLRSLTKEFNWSQVANKSSYCFLLYVLVFAVKQDYCWLCIQKFFESSLLWCYI